MPRLLGIVLVDGRGQGHLAGPSACRCGLGSRNCCDEFLLVALSARLPRARLPHRQRVEGVGDNEGGNSSPSLAFMCSRVCSITRLFSRLLYTVFVSPVLWVLETRGGTQHGTARFARYREVRRDWLTKRGEIYIGLYRDLWGNLHPLTRTGGEHVLLLGPSRSGKGVGCVIPSCIAWNGSSLIHDIKNEIYEASAAYRASLGQKIVRFAPAENGSDAFNPFDCIPEDEGDKLSEGGHFLRLRDSKHRWMQVENGGRLALRRRPGDRDCYADLLCWRRIPPLGPGDGVM